MSKYSYKHHLIKQIATIGIFSGFGILLFKYREGFYILQDLSVFQFVSFSSLVIFGITLSGSKLSRIVNSFNIYLKKSEWFALSSITTVLNGIFFKSGSLATSAYLKKKSLAHSWLRNGLETISCVIKRKGKFWIKQSLFFAELIKPVLIFWSDQGFAKNTHR